jgi:hypothetical protein
MASSA